MYSLQVLGAPLRTEAAPAGIVSFEFAGELSSAQRMVESWGPIGQVYAGLNLGLDFLFLVAYPITIALGCVLVSRSLSSRALPLAVLGVWLAWGQLLAGILDGVENYALIQVLLGGQDVLMPALARACATVKFALVGIGILYVLAGAAMAALMRGSRRAEPAA